MKLLLIQIKNLIPYLSLISLYFLVVNLEARRSQINNNSTEIKDYQRILKDSDIENIRIKIPVLPFKE